MAEDGSTTPEKQLLKLIEDSKGPAEPRPGSGPAAAGLGSKPARFSFSALAGLLAGRFSFWKRSTRKRASFSKLGFDLAWANRLLYIALAGLVVYGVWDAVASAMNLQHPPNFAFQKEKSAGSAAEGVVSPLKEAAYYLQKVTARDIFKEGGKPVAAASEKKQAAPAEPAEAFKSLSLVGISWSSNPDVIIEDKAKQRTFFVKRGQTVGDGVKVEAVFKDHVILSWEGQEFELR